jgi:tRNA threonylcarbamoyl adenosine modification protein (Sua5/YciO/YrdC/YwlC family)
MLTEIIKIHPEFPEKDKIIRCAKVIRQGGLVIFPTETVYGIAADFNNPKAMQRLREVKRRTEGKPFSIHIAQKGLISNYTPGNDPMVFKLIDVCWPGPLTVIVPANEPGKSIGIRIPNHMVALKLIEETQCTIAAPSANFQGNPPPSTCAEALRDMNGLVDLALDSGPAQFGQASSVVDFTKPKPVVVREGEITQYEVDRITQRKVVLFVCTGNSCRSVMAEYLLKELLKDRDDVEVLSAGTSVFVHTAASAETLAVLKREGIDASLHLSQGLSSILLKKSDLIFVMTKSQRQQVLERVPGVENRVYLLREFTDEPVAYDVPLDIPDPMGRPAAAYEECLLTIKEAIAKLVKLI